MFETDYGNGIAKEMFQKMRSKKILFVTQENLLQKYGDIIPDDFTVQCIDNVEEKLSERAQFKYCSR
jgi:hypothetical protein